MKGFRKITSLILTVILVLPSIACGRRNDVVDILPRKEDVELQYRAVIEDSSMTGFGIALKMDDSWHITYKDADPIVSVGISNVEVEGVPIRLSLSVYSKNESQLQFEEISIRSALELKSTAGFEENDKCFYVIDKEAGIIKILPKQQKSDISWEVITLAYAVKYSEADEYKFPDKGWASKDLYVAVSSQFEYKWDIDCPKYDDIIGVWAKNLGIELTNIEGTEE